MSCECRIFLQQSLEVEETPSTLIGEKNIICNRYRNILPCKSYLASLSVYYVHLQYFIVCICTVCLCVHLFVPVHRWFL